MNDEISAKEAAEMLNISDQTVRELIRRGELEARRKTSAKQSPYLIKRASVEAYLKRLENQPEL